MEADEIGVALPLEGLRRGRRRNRREQEGQPPPGEVGERQVARLEADLLRPRLLDEGHHVGADEIDAAGGVLADHGFEARPLDDRRNDAGAGEPDAQVRVGVRPERHHRAVPQFHRERGIEPLGDVLEDVARGRQEPVVRCHGSGCRPASLEMPLDHRAGPYTSLPALGSGAGVARTGGWC